MERLIRVQRSLATGVLRAINKSDSPSTSLYMWIGIAIGWLCVLALMNCLTLGGAHAEVGADGAAKGATVELVAGSSKINSRALITERVPLIEKSPLRSSCSCPLSNRNYLGTATVIIDRESMNLSIESVAESSVKDKGCTPPVRLSAHLIHRL